MKNPVILCLVTATLGVMAGGASASPLTATADAIDMVPVASVVGWQNVCRERSLLRRDARGNVVRLQMPMCNTVWIGRRYFNNGNYYADPHFLTPIY